MIMKRGKKGVSPIIATVLLIAIVIVLVVVIFLWLRGTIKDAITKGGENVELVCDKVKIRASYSDPKIEIVNDGDIPIYDFNIKFVRVGESNTKDVKELLPSLWPTKGLLKGASFSGDISSEVNVLPKATKLLVTPVLRGTSSDGEKVYDCGENFGYEVPID